MRKTLHTLLILCFAAVSTVHGQYTKLFDFEGGSNGAEPLGSFISDGIFLYGMTNTGGANNRGTVFKILPDGTEHTILLDFDSPTNGSFPRGSLIYDGTFLYGMTYRGGPNDLGTVFKIMPDGTGYTKLLDFAGATNGGNPMGSLISDGTFLYGMTNGGGENNLGTAFKILPDGNGYTKLLDFAGETNGSYPEGSLISDGTFLYGMSNTGGANGMGTVFKILPDGTGYIKLLDFAGVTNGSYPRGSLIYDGNFLYGMTFMGGVNDLGTIFKILPDGTGYLKLLNFTGETNGSYPEHSLISDGTFLYGMTPGGGASNLGTVLEIMPDGTDYTKLFDFAGTTNGSYPYGSLILDGTFLYGMTQQGGSANVGTVFKYKYCALNTVSLAGNTLTADENGATYQWLDCNDGNTPISGATAQSYTASTSGNYAVEITKDGCTATSSCISVSFVGIYVNGTSLIKIYPNPSKGKFTLVTEQLGRNYKIIDNIGKVVAEGTIHQTQTEIDLSKNTNGLYLLTIEGHVYKLVKQ